MSDYHPIMDEITRSMSAAEQPCAMYLDHGSATPSITQGHHRHPQYLQKRVYGGVVKDLELLWLCGGCHDSVHAWLYWLVGERAEPAAMPPPRAKKEAETANEWYVAALAAVPPA